MKTTNLTYDVIFHDSVDCNNCGFKIRKGEAINFIKSNNGTNNSYFADYKGGYVTVDCNETGETVASFEVI